MDNKFYNLLHESFEKKNNKLIIIDWDDTLLPTNWIHINENNQKCVNLQDYDDLIVYFLEVCENIGNVIIITNSSSLWINETSEKYLPNTHLKFKRMKLISARDNFQEKYPYNPMEWKINTFKNYVNENNIYNEIISIGDGIYEKNALFNLKNLNKNLYLKSIKLLDKPNFFQLSTQINLILRNINEISNLKKNIDLKINLNDIKQYYI